MTTGNHDIESQAPGKSAQKGDKIEVVRILILALVSFVLGFGLVIFFLSPTDDSKADDLSPSITAGTEESASPNEETADKPPDEKPAPAAAGYAPNATENPLIANLDDNATAARDNEGMHRLRSRPAEPRTASPLTAMRSISSAGTVRDRSNPAAAAIRCVCSKSGSRRASMS